MNSMPQEIADQLIEGREFLDTNLLLALDGQQIQVRSNSEELLARLRGYFAHIVVESGEPDITVLAVERDAPQLDFPYEDWPREPGKTGRKDACQDLPGARVIHKVRTGMTFLQSDSLRIAAGPCVENDNQVINFINNQYMTWLQRNGWRNCHAAALSINGGGLAMAGFSGGGKSTLMLHMLEHPETAFISNDRLFIRRNGDGVECVGIPKLPRINPGTILNNPRLAPMLSAEEQQQLQAMPKAELWDLEQKYDADIDSLYGKGRIETQSCPLRAFMVLNWNRDSDEPLSVERADLSQRKDLLAAIMKSPGPFYQDADGAFHQGRAPFDEKAYLAVLESVLVYEARGGVDFDALAERYLNL
ncbi:HprK-related kinase B [Marinobacterium mangrovicola]|uniref:HprK-related kinase B n=2 Tax=Marinobacterium mangrovicola TaxID=1476959 RepID=A0A4R1GXP3_9GAMM|nr:HprK-related kinase B [Marinobacterium mangrovicola]